MKATKKIELLCLLIIFFNSIVYAQSSAPQLPDIIPPEPVASQFQKFLGYPVSPATGLADISIPLYTLQASGVTIPFSLKYHSGGIKVDDAPGNIGYGWSLYPGFRVTRTIMGNPDDYARTNDIRNDGQLNYEGMNQYLVNIGVHTEMTNGPRIDGQYDIFSVHLPTIDASFIMQWVNGELKGIPIPYAPIKITPVFRGANSSLFYFNITDDKGITYILGQNHVDYSGNNGWGASSEWMLEQIIAPGVNNTINFNYQNSSISTLETSIQSLEVDDYKLPYNSDGPYQSAFGSPAYNSNHPPYTFNTWALTSITFPTGRVELSYSDQDNSKLASINAYNADNTTVKSISFTPIAGWNLLYSVAVSGEGQYTFEYDMQPFTYQFGQDFWGLYNGQNNPSLIPSINLDIHNATDGSVSYMPINLANRQPDETKMQSHILKKINYPTGGSTSFNYEAHRYISKNVPSFGIGLRVASTAVYDPVSGKTITSTYKYGYDESGLGTLGTNFQSNGMVSAIDETAFVSDKLLVSNGYGGGSECIISQILSMRRRTVSSHNRYSNFNFNIPVWYPQVTVYSNGGKTIYNYDYTPSDFFSYPVNLVQGMGVSNTNNYFIGNLRNIGLSGPRLRFKQVKDAGNYPLQETTYNYTGDKTVITGLLVEPTTSYSACNGTSMHRYTYQDMWNGFVASEPVRTNLLAYTNGPFIIRNYFIEAGNDNLSSTSQVDYTWDGPFNGTQITTSYTYDPVYTFNVASKTVNASNAGTITEKYYYPVGDQAPDIGTLTPSQQSMVTTLKNANYLTTPVQKQIFKNTTLQSSQLTGYKDWGNSLYAPEQVYFKLGSNPFESRLHYHNYDNKGKVLSVSKEGDVKHSYIWDYSQTYPIAHATDAEQKDIFHTSFEDADGNSSNGDSKTGRKSKTNGYSKALSGLTNGNYTLSYWQKSGSTWALQKINITVSGNAYTINVPGQVDELKFYPATAQMTTSTYDLLIGQTSQTDAADRTTYYEYDGFGRLSLVRDQNRNILKKYCYNYQGQTESCPLGVGNEAKSGNFIKQCSGTPVTVTYTVPANTYFAATLQDANAMAQSDVNTNGQAYADNKATCPQVIYARIEYQYQNVHSEQTSTYSNYNESSNVYVRFYSDAGCSTPFTLADPMNVVLHGRQMNEWDGGYSETYGNQYTVLAPAGVHEVMIANLSDYFGRDVDYTQLNSWGDFYTEKWSIELFLEPSAYTIVPKKIWFTPDYDYYYKTN